MELSWNWNKKNKLTNPEPAQNELEQKSDKPEPAPSEVITFIKDYAKKNLGSVAPEHLETSIYAHLHDIGSDFLQQKNQYLTTTSGTLDDEIMQAKKEIILDREQSITNNPPKIE